GRNVYTQRFENREAPVQDSTGPFQLCTLQQLPKRIDPKKRGEVLTLAARQLLLELFTPAGRLLDSMRSEAKTINKAGKQVVSTVGLTRLTWPRREILTVAANRLSEKLIERWISRDSSHLAEPIGVWLDEQWSQRKLQVEDVVAEYDAVVLGLLKEDPNRVFDAFVDPLAQAGKLDAQAVVSVLDQMLQLVGKPSSEHEKSGTLSELVLAKQKEILKGAESHLSALTVSLIEQTQYRLPGAEAALNLLDVRLRRTLDGLTGLWTSLDKEVRDAYGRLFPLIGTVGNPTGLATLASRKAALSNELLDALRQFPRKRLKLMLLDATLDLYRAMHANIPEFLREVTFCRTRLGDIAKTIAERPGPVVAGERASRLILPANMKTLEEMADHYIAALPAQDLITLDQAIQKQTLRKFRGVVNVCVKREHSAGFQTLLLKNAREFLDGRLERSDPTTMFFRYFESNEETAQMLLNTFEEAAPDLTSLSGKPQTEATILACPAGVDGDRFRQLVLSAIPDVEMIPATIPDDIALIREYPLLPLVELPQFGHNALEAFQQYTRNDQTLHTRTDIAWE
ncbi:MAG: hypothetical protein ACRCZF_05465, partial [Gemmataceae bacterium]